LTGGFGVIFFIVISVMFRKGYFQDKKTKGLIEHIEKLNVRLIKRRVHWSLVG